MNELCKLAKNSLLVGGCNVFAAKLLKDIQGFANVGHADSRLWFGMGICCQ